MKDGTTEAFLNVSFSFIIYTFPGILGIGSSLTSVISGNTQYMYGIATGGFQAPGLGDAVNYTSLWNSGTLGFVDIDNIEGNMKGELPAFMLAISSLFYTLALEILLLIHSCYPTASKGCNDA